MRENGGRGNQEDFYFLILKKMPKSIGIFYFVVLLLLDFRISVFSKYFWQY